VFVCALFSFLFFFFVSVSWATWISLDLWSLCLHFCRSSRNPDTTSMFLETSHLARFAGKETRTAVRVNSALLRSSQNPDTGTMPIYLVSRQRLSVCQPVCPFVAACLLVVRFVRFVRFGSALVCGSIWFGFSLGDLLFVCCSVRFGVWRESVLLHCSARLCSWVCLVACFDYAPTDNSLVLRGRTSPPPPRNPDKCSTFLESPPFLHVL
jgi:hypothetical protein